MTLRKNNIMLDDESDGPNDITKRHLAARKSTLVSVGVNIVLTIIQVVTGIFAQSHALIADGIHSFSDLLADFVVLFASHHSHKDADDNHQYGHYRFENAASLILGLLLLVVGVGMLWSATIKFSNPEAIPTVHSIALWVALAALIFKEGLFRYMLKVAESVRSSMLVANAWHARSDAASSLVVACGIIGNLMGYPLLDPVAALVIGLMIAKTGSKFAWKALSDLMDHAATDDELEKIKKTLLETKGVSGIHDLKSRKMGDMIILDVHLEIFGQLTVAEGHQIAVEARRRVMENHQVMNVMTHIDPV